LNGLWHVPFQKNQRFVGRRTALGLLSKFLSSNEYCESVAVFGLGGSGKTQLVLEFAYQKRKEQKECSIFWVPAVNTTTFMEAYRKIGEKLEIPRIEEMAADVSKLVKAVKEKLSDESSGHWLLIFDNVDIFDALDEEENKDTITGSLPLLDCLPNSCQGSIIFTTRNRKAAINLAGANLVEVKAMDLAEAKELLGSLVPERLLGKEKAKINQLLELLTCLPLAITQAGAYMKTENTKTFEYIEYYQENENEALAMLDQSFRDEASNPSNKDFKDGGGYRTIRDPVARTWRISFNQISRKNKIAAGYLSSMACLFNQNIPKSLLPACLSRRQAREAMNTLIAYSFVSERSSGEYYDMHPLVHLVSQDWLRETKTMNSWTKQTISRLAELLPSKGLENRGKWTELLPHAIHTLFLLSPADGDRTTELDLFCKVIRCLETNGEYKKASEVAKREVHLRTEWDLESDPGTLAAMSDVGFILIRLGEYGEAEKWLMRVVELKKAIPGSEDEDTLRAMSALALVLSNRGKLSEAVELNRQILARRETLLDFDHLDIVTTRSKLAAVLCLQGNYTEAEKMHRQVLKSREELLDSEHPDILTSRIHLATVLKNQKKFDEAEAIYRMTLKLDQERDGDDHPHTLSTMSGLGSLLHFQGRNKEAEELLRRAINLREQKLGPMHHHTLLSISNLAMVHNSLDNYTEAEKEQKRALKGFELVLGNNHPAISTAMANLACIYLRKGMREEAGKYITQAIEKTKVDYDETHSDTIASLNNVVAVYLDRGDLEEAEKLGVQVLAMARRELGELHCHTLDSVANLAATHQKQERMEAAAQPQISEANPKKRVRSDTDAENLAEVSKKAKVSLGGLKQDPNETNSLSSTAT
jgi:tetratricopeptide (TPR) repeat protein